MYSVVPRCSVLQCGPLVWLCSHRLLSAPRFHWHQPSFRTSPKDLRSSKSPKTLPLHSLSFHPSGCGGWSSWLAMHCHMSDMRNRHSPAAHYVLMCRHDVVSRSLIIFVFLTILVAFHLWGLRSDSVIVLRDGPLVVLVLHSNSNMLRTTFRNVRCRES